MGMDKQTVHVGGGGLAGSEAAWQTGARRRARDAARDAAVRGTEAHKTGGLAELVRSNSFCPTMRTRMR
jgi:methylenetetrahydrofolate--tRNA-(uracil-5-)-methyltransferase